MRKVTDTEKLQGKFKGFPDSSVGKEATCNAEGPSLIPGLGRSAGEGTGIHSSILASIVPWAEEPGRLQSTGSQKVRHK